MVRDISLSSEHTDTSVTGEVHQLRWSICNPHVFVQIDCKFSTNLMKNVSFLRL